MQEDNRIGHTLSHATSSPNTLIFNTCSHTFSHIDSHNYHMQYMLTHNMISHATHDTLPHMRSHVPMHTCTRSWYRFSQIPMCLPKMFRYIHSDRKRPQKNKPGSRAGHTYGHLPKTHGQTQNTQFKNPYAKIHTQFRK